LPHIMSTKKDKKITLAQIFCAYKICRHKKFLF